MNFLGQASNYPFGRALRHLFACGTRRDSDRLRAALAARYSASLDQVALYRSGRSALAQGIMATLEPGSKIIVPGFTCIAVIRAIKAAGCEPVFADITPGDLDYDYKSLDKIAQSCYNGGIVAQNTLGLPLDMRRLERFAAQHHLQIIEDLAHSAGRFYSDGREVGTVGAVVALSFGKGKAIDTVCGGALILRQPTPTPQPSPSRLPRLSDRLRDRWYPLLGGATRVLWPTGLGKPLLATLVHLRWIERSADTTLNLDTRLTHWQAKLALRQLADLPTGPLREFRLVHDRDELLAKLERAGYAWSDIWYTTPVAPARYLDEADFPTAQCPQAVAITDGIINIPTWFPPRRLTKARNLIHQYELSPSIEPSNHDRQLPTTDQTPSRQDHQETSHD